VYADIASCKAEEKALSGGDQALCTIPYYLLHHIHMDKFQLVDRFVSCAAEVQV